MSVFLQILKITGLVLLILAAILLILVLLILFAPIRYRIQGSYHEKKLKMKVRLTLLMYLLGFHMDITKSGTVMYFRIFGIKKPFSNRDNPKEFEDTIKDSSKKTESSVFDPSSAGHELFMASSADTQETEDYEDNSSHTAHWGQKINRYFRQLQNLYQRLKYILTQIKSKTREFGQFIRNEENRAAFRKLKENTFSLLKYMSPKKSKLDLKYSAGAPDITGELLGILALFPIGYKYRWNIIPDFVTEEAYAEADFNFQGHLYGIQILVLLLGIVLDKNCQKLYNRIMNMK